MFSTHLPTPKNACSPAKVLNQNPFLERQILAGSLHLILWRHEESKRTVGARMKSERVQTLTYLWPIGFWTSCGQLGKKTNFMWHIPSSIHQELWWVMNADVFFIPNKGYIYICLLPVTQIQTELPNTPMRTGHLWRQTRQTLNFWTPNNYNQSLPNLCCGIASIEKYLRLGLHKTHQCSGEEERKQFLIVCSFILWFIDSFIHPSFHNNRASWDGKKWALAELLGSTSTRPGQPRFCWDTLEQMP